MFTRSYAQLSCTRLAYLHGLAMGRVRRYPLIRPTESPLYRKIKYEGVSDNPLQLVRIDLLVDAIQNAVLTPYLANILPKYASM